MLDCDATWLGVVVILLTILTTLGYVVQSIAVHIGRQFPSPDCCSVKGIDGVRFFRRTSLATILVNVVCLAWMAFVVVDCSDEAVETFEEQRSRLTTAEYRRGRTWVNTIYVVSIVYNSIPVMLGVLAWLLLGRYFRDGFEL